MYVDNWPVKINMRLYGVGDVDPQEWSQSRRFDGCWCSVKCMNANYHSQISMSGHQG